ncbi:MAG: VWA domain-containing protein, partial [Chitinophagales bacterium]
MKTLLIISSFFAVFCYFEVNAQPSSGSIAIQQTPLINVQANLDNIYYMPDGEKKFIYLYVTAQAAKYPERDKNTPLNLSLVLDRSGSMSGAKLKYAREASKIVIDHLDENDQLSIIAYDHEIEVMQSSLSITNNKTRKQLKRKIDAIYDNGSTNLGGGMLEGFNQVDKHYEEQYVNRVLLLSDGLANKGITDPDALQDTAQYFNRHQN